MKLEDLRRQLLDKEKYQSELELQLRELDREVDYKMGRVERAKDDVSSKNREIQDLRDMCQKIQRNIEAFEEDKKRMLSDQSNEGVKRREYQARERDLEEKESRRDIELRHMQENLREVEHENKRLRQRYETLLEERDALEKHSQNIIQANKDIEKELDNFVNADESIVKTMRDRDDRLSPIRSIAKEGPLQMSTNNGVTSSRYTLGGGQGGAGQQS